MHSISRIQGPMNDAGTSTPAKRAGLSASRREAAADRVELSSDALALNKDDQAAGLRLALIAKVRSQIEAGTYDTTQRLDAAVERLLRHV